MFWKRYDGIPLALYTIFHPHLKGRCTAVPEFGVVCMHQHAPVTDVHRMRFTRQGRMHIEIWLWPYDCKFVKSLWPSEAILRHKTVSTLVQVMACCLTAPSHYLNLGFCVIHPRELQHELENYSLNINHDYVIKWKHFPRNWAFVRGIHRSRWIPHTKASDASFEVFFDLRLNKRLSKQPWGWWSEKPS